MSAGMISQRDRAYCALVGYFGVLQAVHLAALLGSVRVWLTSATLGPLAPPPMDGWSEQITIFLLGNGLLDALIAPAGIAFAIGHRRRAAWAGWLGSVALTGSLYSAGLFAFGTLAAGAWSAHPLDYALITALFLPVLPLFWLHARAVLGSGPGCPS